MDEGVSGQERRNIIAFGDRNNDRLCSVMEMKFLADSLLVSHPSREPLVRGKW